MNAEIITVGTELLLGDITDTNSQFLSRELAEYGIHMLYKSTVGDNPERLGKVLSLAMSRSDLIVIA
ncbi:MAG: competence/damage-inducible protein A, partial [Clostridiales bacterium]|nr:competence/damage-inducible protein A [Clostridiales bacterium]